MRHIPFLFVLALGAGLTSCVFSPAPEPPAQGSPGHFTLREALALAERLHPELAASEAQVQAAEGRSLQAGLFPNPELMARTESAPVTGSFASQAEYVVGISQPFPLGNRLSAAHRVEALDRDRLLH